MLTHAQVLKAIEPIEPDQLIDLVVGKVWGAIFHPPFTPITIDILESLPTITVLATFDSVTGGIGVGFKVNEDI